MRLVGLLLACALLVSVSACATQAEMRAEGPVAGVVVQMSVANARDCIADNWFGGFYGRSVAPYRDGYRIRNSSGHVYEFVEVQPSGAGATISAYSSLGRGGLSGEAIKRCSSGGASGDKERASTP